VEQVVTASSDKAYGAQPALPYDEDMPLLAVNPYDVSKACADLISTSYHRTFDVPVCVTRCGNFFGPGDRNWERLVPGTIRSLLRGERPIIRSDGSMVRDYLYVVDGALAYMRLVEAMAADPAVIGEAFNFSTETPLTVLQLVAELQKAAGTDLEPDIRATATHEIDSQFLSATKARKVLGWEPTRSVEAALGETVDWYRSHLLGPA
jgi:CDP-glucose 4,6-dehydratase